MRHRVLPLMLQRGPIVAWIVADTVISKKGRHPAVPEPRLADFRTDMGRP